MVTGDLLQIKGVVILCDFISQKTVTPSVPEAGY